jgi:hypothetical protein
MRSLAGTVLPISMVIPTLICGEAWINLCAYAALNLIGQQRSHIGQGLVKLTGQPACGTAQNPSV